MRALLDLVLPTECAGCGAAGPVACAGCAAALCHHPRRCWPRPAPAGLPTPYAVAPYADTTRSFLIAYKEHGVVGLHRVLGPALAVAVAGALDHAGGAPVWLVPVPSTRASRRRRGDDVVARLARSAAGRLRAAGADVAVLPALAHRRKVSDSAGLSAPQRAANLAGAFRARRGSAQALSVGRVVLVDDLITTGTTLAECAAVLRSAGGDVVAAATVAATRREPAGEWA